MAKVLFKTDAVINGEVLFKAGEVYEISNELGSVDRWVKRGAEVVEEDKVVVEREEVKVESIQQVLDVVSEDLASDDEALQCLAGEEEVVNEDAKKENKRARKNSKGI